MMVVGVRVVCVCGWRGGAYEIKVTLSWSIPPKPIKHWQIPTVLQQDSLVAVLSDDSLGIMGKIPRKNKAVLCVKQEHRIGVRQRLPAAVMCCKNTANPSPLHPSKPPPPPVTNEVLVFWVGTRSVWSFA